MKGLIMVSLMALGMMQAPLPTVNQQIVEYCKSQENKKIDRGECWDLAAGALDFAHANWTRPYDYGTKYNFKKDTILPGDIIQFENVEFKTANYLMTMPHHTAIVMEVLAAKKCIIAHQNFGGKRYVQFTEVNFEDLNKGKIQFYRPRGQ